MSGCPELSAVPPLSLLLGCVRKANCSCLIRPPQMRLASPLGRRFDSGLALCLGGRCIRDDSSEGVRQQVSKLVIHCLEQRLHRLSRRKALQGASTTGLARRSLLEGGLH